MATNLTPDSNHNAALGELELVIDDRIPPQKQYIIIHRSSSPTVTSEAPRKPAQMPRYSKEAPSPLPSQRQVVGVIILHIL